MRNRGDSNLDSLSYDTDVGVLLVVDATDGPMPQTKYVLSKSLQHKLPAIVVINKVDRPSSRVGEVENEILDLFVSLDADDDLLDFPIIYASGRDGWAIRDQSEPYFKLFIGSFVAYYSGERVEKK